MKEIQLTKGMTTIVDDEDYELLMQWKWQFHSFSYAKRCSFGRDILMHRQLMNASEDQEVDHINLNKLDNRRNNLRLCTQSQNQMNRPMYKNNTSGYKGVFRYKGKFKAQLQIGGEKVYLGLFDDPAEAYDAYCEEGKNRFGEFFRA